GVLAQPLLDLGGGHPDAAGLDDVVGAAQRGEVAVGAAHVGVAGAYPVPLEHQPRGLHPAPVTGRGGAAADEQVAGGPVGHRHAVGVDDLRLVTGDDLAGTACAGPAGATADEDVQPPQ